MFSLRHLVIATSTALVLTGTLAGGTNAAPPPIPSPIVAVGGQQEVPTFSVDQALSSITKARTAATVTVGTTTGEIDSQIARIGTALEDADIASMQVSEDFALAEDTASGPAPQLAAIAGTSLASLSSAAPSVDLKQAAAAVADIRTASEAAQAALGKKRTELIKESAKLRNTSVAAETKRIDKARATANAAAMRKTLRYSETSVPDLAPATTPGTALEDTTATLAAGMTTTGAGTAAMAVPSAISISTKAPSRAVRINKSVAWAKKVASNNKYKYRYGSTGPTYFDCSGYTGKAFASAGKKLQRTSSQQYKAAPAKVKLSKLTKGDLVFWSSNGGRSFYHVALYIGGGKIAHARNPSAGISVTKLNYAGMRNIYKYGGRY
ncbi:C40 family peptidase [Paeniglutamicibacter cryotolerans]|uniref:Cell wall-associated NlpC family hydrolase n=1 Tax=Paeniglutamicibacter cryotolerans TaxID=670079 RepID=A0A839QHJ3_9MICC|nr:C40 family peptidase [Paeniglutamicibacter cryotolerans]MBB2995083.1 cell wall-associated NlpC family hydrolase [Paeniglutamicibacter cryotolerans]